MGNAKSIYAPTLEARPEPATFPPEAFLVDQISEYPLDFPGYVYVIQWGDDGPVKIGMAAYPDARLNGLQVGNWTELFLRALVPTPCKPKVVERVAHRLAVPHLIRGEWFDLTPLEAVSVILHAARDVEVPVAPFEQSAAWHRAVILSDNQMRVEAHNTIERNAMRRRLGMD